MYEEEIRKANTPEALLQVIRSILEFEGNFGGGDFGYPGDDAAIQQRALDIRAKNPSFDLPPVPSSLMPVDMQNWCITASKCFHKPSGGQALGGPGKEGAGGKAAEVPWSDDAPEYLPNSEALKMADGCLELKELGRLLTPSGEIRYMRKGHRGKVHVQDFRRYLRNHPDPESAITDELIDKHLSDIQARKAEIDKQRRTK